MVKRGVKLLLSEQSLRIINHLIWSVGKSISEEHATFNNRTVSTLKMEAAYYLEISTNTSMWCHNPEYHNLNSLHM